MKLRLPASWRLLAWIALMNIALPNLATSASAEPLPLERAIRLALAHSANSAIAQVDVQRAIASYHELRDNRIPQLYAGSGLGYSYGFPLAIEGSAPSLVTIVAQSPVLNLAQDKYLGRQKRTPVPPSLRKRISATRSFRMSPLVTPNWQNGRRGSNICSGTKHRFSKWNTPFQSVFRRASIASST